MLQVGSYKYTDNEHYTAVLVPFENQVNAIFVMTKVNTKESISSFLSGLADEGFDSLIDKLELNQGCISIPRFRFNSRGDLSGALKNMGIKEIFTPNADFSSISPSLKETGLSSFVQAVTIEVDEEGKDFEGYKKSESEGFHFKANRNFLYFLHDERTGAILVGTHVNDVSSRQVPDAQTCVFVGNLPMNTVESDLAEIFGSAVKQISIRTNKERKPFAFLDYSSKADAASAVAQFNGYDMKGNILKLDFDVGLNNKTPRVRPGRANTARTSRRSPSPRRRRSPSPRRRRSPSPRRRSPRRRSPSPRRRSPSPRRRRSPSPRRRRSPSPRRRRSPSPRRGRSPSPKHRRKRSPSPRKKSSSPKRRRRSSSSSSPSPKKRRSPSSSSSSSRSSRSSS
eukprot:TRINITY_DN6366_c0_g1_i6.p1 TRINITY_DN6366_c0_g1~~TRINITY_DN6366_c0_g1_i6.p1  ORF type:complete len:396 (-),score=131.57 TRINITY_DN6366_c0_g1_i6:59-1246(-)